MISDNPTIPPRFHLAVSLALATCLLTPLLLSATVEGSGAPFVDIATDPASGLDYQRTPSASRRSSTRSSSSAR